MRWNIRFETSCKTEEDAIQCEETLNETGIVKVMRTETQISFTKGAINLDEYILLMRALNVCVYGDHNLYLNKSDKDS